MSLPPPEFAVRLLVIASGRQKITTLGSRVLSLCRLVDQLVQKLNFWG